MIGALLPNISGEPAFGASFPEGSFSLTGSSVRVLGLDGTNLVGEGQWGGGRISFAQLSAETWGGIGFDTTLNAAGTLEQPVLSGSGLLRVEAGDAPALQRLYDIAQMPQGWRDFLALSAPADLLVNVEEPLDGPQVVTLSGALGVGELNLRAELSGGLGALATAPLRVTGGLESTDVDGLIRQIGFGDAALFDGEGSMLVSFGLEGAPSNSLVSSLTASLGNENLSFSGNLLVANDGELQGTGTLDATLADAGALARIAGARGLSLPLASGSAQLHFEGERLARLTEIAGMSGEIGFSGELSLSRTGTTTAVSGDIAVDMVSVEGLAATLFGPAALVAGDGVWPEGPLGTTDQPRQTRGTVAVTAGALAAGGTDRLGVTSFELSWDETRIRLARFEAAVDAGTLGLDISVCCAGPLVDRTISGRMTLDAVPIDAIATPAIAGALDGLLDGGLRFEGSGGSLAEAMATVSGEGNFTLSDFTAQRLSPQVYATVAGLDDVLNMDADAMGTIMEMALGQGEFKAPTVTGAFTVAGGVVRLANLIVDGEGAGLAGSLNLALPTAGLTGSFAMTPTDFEDASGLVGADTSRIIARIAGTLMAPQVDIDLAEMIAAIQVRANEMEVDRLEALQAEDAARQRTAAEERNRLIEEQRQRAAAEAARIAAEEEAAEEAARQQELERQLLLQQQLQLPRPTPARPPIDLGLPPVNQPAGPGVNQSF